MPVYHDKLNTLLAAVLTGVTLKIGILFWEGFVKNVDKIVCNFYSIHFVRFDFMEEIIPS